MLAIFAEEVTFPMVLAILVGNSILEAAASVIVCVAVMAFRIGLGKKSKKSKLEESEDLEEAEN